MNFSAASVVGRILCGSRESCVTTSMRKPNYWLPPAPLVLFLSSRGYQENRTRSTSAIPTSGSIQSLACFVDLQATCEAVEAILTAHSRQPAQRNAKADDSESDQRKCNNLASAPNGHAPAQL